MNGIDEIKWDKDGLAPAIAQDAATGEVLSVVARETDATSRRLRVLTRKGVPSHWRLWKEIE